jgi:hypothetical protein
MSEPINDQEIGERLRALQDGSEPDATAQLRRFVRDRTFVQATLPRTATGSRPNSFRRALVGIAAALLLVVAGTGLWLSQHGPINGEKPTPTGTTSPSATTSSQSSSPSTVPTSGATVWKSRAWTSSATQPPLPNFGIAIPNVGYFGSCYMGLSHADWGYIGYPYCTSPDGLNWSVLTDPTFNGIYVSGAAYFDGEFVMVGGVEATGQAVVFRSANAVNWTRLPDSDLEQKALSLKIGSSTQSSPTPMGALVSGPAGLVATGWHDEWQQAPNPPAAIWRSTDGTNWTAALSPVEGKSNLFVANGRYFLSGTGPGFQLSYSDDGMVWTKATADTGSPGAFFSEMYGTGGGSVFGTTVDGIGYSSSDNGQSWTQDNPQTGGLEACSIGSVTLKSNSYSVDGGTTWQTVESAGPPLAPDCGTTIGDGTFGYMIGDTSGLAWFGKPTASPTPTASPSALASATSTPALSASHLVWTKGDSTDINNAPNPQSLTPTFGLPVPTGGYFGTCSQGQPHSEWPYVGYRYCTSSDGLHWSVSKDPTFTGMVVAAAAKGNGGYVLVGTVMATNQAVVFRSSDAVHWTRDAASNVAQMTQTLDGTTEPTPMGDVVWGPNGYVAVGWHDGWQQAPNPPSVVWHSADGVKWTAETSPMDAMSRVFSVGGRYFLSGRGTLADEAGFWYCSDDGVTWKQTTADAIAAYGWYVFAMFERADGKLVAIADTGDLSATEFSSTDGGVSWHSEGTSKATVSEFAEVPGLMFEYDVSQSRGYVSTDRGATWQTVDPKFGQFISLGDAVLAISVEYSTADNVTPTTTTTWITKP